MGVTARHNIRVETQLWDAAVAKAQAEGTNLSHLMRGWMTDYVADEGSSVLSEFDTVIEALQTLRSRFWTRRSLRTTLHTGGAA